MTSLGSRIEEAARLPRAGLSVPVTLPAQRAAADGGSPEAAIVADIAGTGPAGQILLIDPDATAAQSFARALTAMGIATVSTAPGFDQSAAGVSPGANASASVAIVSLRLGTAVPGTIAALRAAGWTRVIALSTAAGIGDIAGAMRAGATGAVVAGHAAPARNVPTGIYDLSPREVEVLRMVADGRSNKWIGDQLELSALTVKSHLARIGRKLGTGDRAHMVTLALRASVIN